MKYLIKTKKHRARLSKTKLRRKKKSKHTRRKLKFRGGSSSHEIPMSKSAKKNARRRAKRAASRATDVKLKYNTMEELYSDRTIPRRYVLSSHGGIILNEPIDISEKNIKVFLYSKIGETCFSTKKDPNSICLNKPYSGNVTPTEFNNLIPDLMLYPDDGNDGNDILKYGKMDETKKKWFKSGVKNCSNDSIILNIDDIPIKKPCESCFGYYSIFLSDVIKTIEQTEPSGFELHILVCLDYPDCKVNFDKKYLSNYS